MTHKARFYIKRRIRFEMKFVIFVGRKTRVQHGELWSTISDETPILKITQGIDQRINGVPKLQVEQDLTRREIVAILTGHVLQGSNREKLMEDLSPQDGRKPQAMIEETKSIIS